MSWHTKAVDVLMRGQVVACPTETLVGLLANATDAEACARVAMLKGRAAGHPMGLLAKDQEMVERVATLTPVALKLAEAHWPGPLTMVLKARDGLPKEVLSGETVAIRVPSSSAAAELCQMVDFPLTATSANRTGEEAVRSCAELPPAFAKTIPFLCPGESPLGLASTIVDVTGTHPVLLRRGAITITTSDV